MAGIVRSLLDTDFYKLAMLQMIHALHGNVRVRFSVINRKRQVRLADEIDIADLRRELDAARALRFSDDELEWLARTPFYGQSGLFRADYLDWLRSFELPDYKIDIADGQFELTFEGAWERVTLWETPALAIVSELRGRAALAGLHAEQVAEIESCADERLTGKLQRLMAISDLRLSDFGTRRRHGYDWQKHVIERCRDALGARFTGTSNVQIARELGLPASGTNAHELPMVLVTLADGDEQKLAAVYGVLSEWQQFYGEGLKIVLPDTYGTAHFLAHAPDWVADWAGFRPDSGPPLEGGDRIIAWWQERGRDPREKVLIFSDALDIDGIERIAAHFRGRVKVAFGWGTDLTNDFTGCGLDEQMNARLAPASIVCKITQVEGRPAVKLSDNPEKATGDPAEVSRYLALFGSAGRVSAPVRF